MTRLTRLGCGLLTVVGLAAPAVGCSKTKQAPAAPAVQAAPEKPPAVATPMPTNQRPTVGNVTSTASEHIAAGKAEPAKTRESAANPSGAVYHGNPEMQLDSKTLADVRSTVEQTCQLLEEGVDLLEKNAKTPEKAAAAINAYRKKNAARIQQVFKAAADVKARLRSVGYDQDIPAEVRPAFEKRMGAIQERLEAMRTTYRKHRDVLEAFGQLFPRAQ